MAKRFDCFCIRNDVVVVVVVVVVDIDVSSSDLQTTNGVACHHEDDTLLEGPHQGWTKMSCTYS